MLHISTGPAHGWEVDFNNADAITLNGQPFTWDFAALGDGRYHVLHNGKSYNAELLAADYTTKTFVLKINSQRIELQAKDRFDQLLERMGLSNTAVAHAGPHRGHSGAAGPSCAKGRPAAGAGSYENGKHPEGPD
jgi:hypothetical protein